MKNNSIKISCECKDSLNLNELSEFQGELKARTDDDVRKVVNSIKKHGFSFPFFVWKHDDINSVLDGHGRLLGLYKLDEQGFEIPPLPVVYVDCKNEKGAKDLLLRLNSQYGRMTKKSVMDFIGKDFDLNFEDFKFPAFTLNLTSPFESTDDFYNQQIEKRDYVSPTTTAPNPVVNESPLEKLDEMPTDDSPSDFCIGTPETKDYSGKNVELSIDAISCELDCRCPRCGMEFNSEKNRI